MKEIPVVVSRNRVQDGPGSDLGPQSHEQGGNAGVESEFDKMTRRLERLDQAWRAKPVGMGESVSSHEHLLDGRYRHPRGKISD